MQLMSRLPLSTLSNARACPNRTREDRTGTLAGKGVMPLAAASCRTRSATDWLADDEAWAATGPGSVGWSEQAERRRERTVRVQADLIELGMATLRLGQFRNVPGYRAQTPPDI